MRNKKLIIVALFVMLALSACVPANSAPQRTLSVNGAGQVSVTPDIAYIYIGVHTEKGSASDAVDENNKVANRVIQALKDAGVDAKDIRTDYFSIWPFDKYDSMTGMPTGEKYYGVDNTVYVTVRDLNSLGSLLDDAIAAGATTINSIQFDVADKESALVEAREAAMQNAKDQATELATLAGLEVGEIQNISFYDSSPYPMYGGYGMGGGGGDAYGNNIPIQPGQMTLQVTVSLTYVLK